MVITVIGCKTAVGSERLQSGFRQSHSTEAALVRILNDILLNADAGEVPVLVLLDVSATFDTVDHNICFIK